MASVEPMTMGSPFGSPSSPGTAHASHTYLPAYLLGEQQSIGHSPSGRLWSSSTGSPPKGSSSLNKSINSPQIQSGYSQTPRQDQRARDLVVGRGKEKAGAPPVSGLLETISSPAPEKASEFHTPGGGRVPKLGGLFATPQRYNTPGMSHASSHDLSYLDQSLHGRKTLASPAQVDPFYTQEESLRPEDDLDETWVTVFGFPPAATSFIVQQFSQYGNILKHVIASDGNWMHIHYQSKLQAKKALSKNAKIYGNSIMIGVAQCIDKAVMASTDTRDLNSSCLQRSVLAERSLNESQLDRSGLNASRNTSIRPLTAAYRAAQAEHQVVQSNTPQKKEGLVGKTMHYVFGW